MAAELITEDLDPLLFLFLDVDLTVILGLEMKVPPISVLLLL